MPIMKALERMQQILIKVGKRVSKITPGKKKLKKMQQKLSKVDERVTKKTDMKGTEKLNKMQPTRSKVPGEKSNDARVPPVKDGGHGRRLCATPRARALRMHVASCYVPNHDEDAHFVLPDAGVAGVADGVGGYRKRGVDAGAFARALMSNASSSSGRNRSPNSPVCPYTLLRRSYEAAARSRTPGASTAAIVSLDGAAHTLRWAYVGDSAFAVLRGGKVVHRSRPQRHRANCPYQLCAHGGGDSVAAAVVGEMAVADGDVVVVGTDGLFDNVLRAELEWLVQKGTELGLSPQDVADSIAGTARWIASGGATLPHSALSLDSSMDGKEYGNRISGKVDDITVIVAFVVASDL